MIIKNWENFISENVQRAKSFVAKKLESWEKLKEMLKANPGYLGKFTEYLFDDKVPLEELETRYKNLLDLKRKGRSIDIEGLNYEGLLDRIIIEYDNLKISKLLSKFPSTQKALIGNFEKNPTKKNTLLKLAEKENLGVFISKISRYKTEDELMTAIRIFIKSIQNDKSTVIEKVSNMKISKVVLEKENILIVKVGSIEDLKELASDCSWCILRDSMWKSYTNNRLQYILFDYTKDEFDPLFKIGITLNKDGGIHAAHNILDGSVIPLIKTYFKELNIDPYKDLILNSFKKIDISDVKIVGSISNAKLKSIIDQTPQEQYIDIIKKIMKLTIKVNSNFSDIRKIVGDWMTHKGFQFYSYEDLENEIPGFLKWYEESTGYEFSSNKLISKKNVSIDPIGSFFAGLDIWSDELLINCNINIGIHWYVFLKNNLLADDERYRKLLNRLFKLDKNKILSTDKKDSFIFKLYFMALWAKEEKVGLSKSEKSFMDKLIPFLGREFKSNFREKTGYGIDLLYNFPRNKGEISEVIKRDYSTYIFSDDLELLYDTIEYLNGYDVKIHFNSSIHSKFSKSYKIFNNYAKEGKRPEVRQMAQSILKNRKTKLFTTELIKNS